MEPAFAAKPVREVGIHRQYLPRNDPPGAEKYEIKPWLKEEWCIPPQANAAFVCQMEDVLEIYKLPYDAKRPVLCMDEMPKQLLADKREPTRCEPGKSAMEDYEYKRNGVEDLFMVFEPLQGKRFVEMEDQRRRIEWAHFMKFISDELQPEAEKIVVVLDNLNTHTPVSFYEAFEPAEARRLADRIELHFTPKHGSWLNMTKIELRALTRQCLDRRIPDKETLIREVSAWQNQRYEEVVKHSMAIYYCRCSH